MMIARRAISGGMYENIACEIGRRAVYLVRVLSWLKDEVITTMLPVLFFNVLARC